MLFTCLTEDAHSDRDPIMRLHTLQKPDNMNDVSILMCTYMHVCVHMCHCIYSNNVA